MNKFTLIAGPCVIEDEMTTMKIAEELVLITNKYEIPFIFKASYRKANRTKGDSFKGIGDLKALQVLADIKAEYEVEVLTDIHECQEAPVAASYVDILQIPAFLCKQTDLLIAAAKTGRKINIKKGQFASWKDMYFAVEKIRDAGNDNIMITERGTTFGYDDLVIDFRNIIHLQGILRPVIVDITHSLGRDKGNVQMILVMAKTALAAGADGLFIETHPCPIAALSDSDRMLPLSYIEPLMKELCR